MEIRFATEFLAEPSNTPGLALDADGNVKVVLPGGSRSDLFLPSDEKNPIVLSAPFTGAGADTDATEFLMVAPYDGTITQAIYVPSSEIVFGSSQGRTWTLEDRDGNALMEATVDASNADLVDFTAGITIGMEAPVTGALWLLLKTEAVNGDAPSDPGGLVVFYFVDPPGIDLGSVVQAVYE